MRRGFTLIELLVVLVLISLIVSTIAPKGYKLMESISKKIEKKEDLREQKLLFFKAFISETQIEFENNTTINSLGILVE